MGEVRAIFFDAAGTILHAHPSVGHVYAEVLARYGASANASAMDSAFRKAFFARRASSQPSAVLTIAQGPEQGRAVLSPQSSLANEGYDWWHALVFEVLDSLQIKVRQPNEFFRELYWRFADPEVWRLFPDALPALLETRGRGLQTALISNWDVRLRRVVHGMGIGSLFDALVISTEVGFEKPDPRIFRIACARLGIEPGETLHVGDSIREDVEGARAAGISATLLDRTGFEDEERQVITDLRQCLSHLRMAQHRGDAAITP
jgi:putative hydrolase of the HAD superfamily